MEDLNVIILKQQMCMGYKLEVVSGGLMTKGLRQTVTNNSLSYVNLNKFNSKCSRPLQYKRTFSHTRTHTHTHTNSYCHHYHRQHHSQGHPPSETNRIRDIYQRIFNQFFFHCTASYRVYFHNKECIVSFNEHNYAMNTAI